MWGRNPTMPRAENLLLHLACACLVYAIARRVMPQDPAAAGIAAVFFALHPSHELTLWWIACRMELLCTLFYLLSVLTFIQFLDRCRVRWLVASTVAGVLALCSKEMAYSLPVLLGALAFLRPGPTHSRLRLAVAAAPMAAVAAGFLALRLLTMPVEGTAFAWQVGVAHVKTVLYLATRHFLFPYHLSLKELITAHPFIAVGGAAAVWVAVALRWRRLFSPPTLIATAWCVITFLPVVRTMNAWTLYIPSVGLAMAVAWLLEPERAPRAIPAAIVLVILVASFAAHFQARKSAWHYADRVARNVVEDFRAFFHADEELRPALVTVPGLIDGVPIYMHCVERHLRQALGDPAIAPLVLAHIVMPHTTDDGPISVQRAARDTFEIRPTRTTVFAFPDKAEWAYAFPQFQSEQAIDLPWGQIVLYGPNNDKSLTTAIIRTRPDLPAPKTAYYYAASHLHRVQ
jgi:hypothetical protein